MLIRLFKQSDTEQIARLFHKTVREVNCADYSPEQLKAWAPDNIHFKDWESSCLSSHTFVADDDGTIAGFAQLRETGYIDCFYCHKDYQKIGIGSMLFERILQKARELHLKELTVEASVTARPFFRNKGFGLIIAQEVYRRGQVLKNFLMRKTI
ncbi:MAG: GNAT family N-acetyltransferase [Balneolaceae bacterium]|nr:GNAT family N-acetyltransferase [Balneolaceae bacterium]